MDVQCTYVHSCIIHWYDYEWKKAQVTTEKCEFPPENIFKLSNPNQTQNLAEIQNVFDWDILAGAVDSDSRKLIEISCLDQKLVLGPKGFKIGRDSTMKSINNRLNINHQSLAILNTWASLTRFCENPRKIPQKLTHMVWEWILVVWVT